MGQQQGRQQGSLGGTLVAMTAACPGGTSSPTPARVVTAPGRQAAATPTALSSGGSGCSGLASSSSAAAAPSVVDDFNANCSSSSVRSTCRPTMGSATGLALLLPVHCSTIAPSSPSVPSLRGCGSPPRHTTTSLHCGLRPPFASRE